MVSWPHLGAIALIGLPLFGSLVSGMLAGKGKGSWPALGGMVASWSAALVLGSYLLDSALQDAIVKQVQALGRDLHSVDIHIDQTGRLRMSETFGTTLKTDLSGVAAVLLGDQGFFTRMANKLGAVLENGAQAYAATYPLNPPGSYLSIYA